MIIAVVVVTGQSIVQEERLVHAPQCDARASDSISVKFEDKATNFIGNIDEISDLPSFIMLAFHNRLQYRNSDIKRLNDNNVSVLCRNFVRFGPVVSDITMLQMITFATIRQKSTRHAKYLLEQSLPNLRIW